MTDHHSGRALSGKFMLAVTVGGVIGLGILRGPGEIAAVIRDPWIYLGLWWIVGLFVLLSTSVCIELVGMTPRSGGIYPLIRHAYGPYPGFVIGWVDWLSFVADNALKAVVIVEFSTMLVPAVANQVEVMAIGVTTTFALFQLKGIALSALIQEIATAGIGLVVVVLAVLLFLFEAPAADGSAVMPVRSSLNDWSLVIATIVFTYDGWLYASYFSGEIRGGAGAVARSGIKAMVIVIALYLLLNGALVRSVGLDALAGSELALATALELSLSPAAGIAVVVAAIMILLSHQNLNYLSAPRVLKALAEDGFAVRRAGATSRGGNPIFAVVVTWVLTVAVILQGGFEFLLLLSVFFYIPLYLALIIGVLNLRRREPDSERPFRAWGHPWSTVFCLVIWSTITLFQAYVERETALYALVMVAFSWPVYRYLKKRSAAAAPLGDKRVPAET